jgi:ABC-type transporter Mla maintaining outer membrane lipid asymmetry ATPase subunit MlaF
MSQNPSTQSAEPLVEMINVTVTAHQNGDLPVLENINWTIRRGDFWVVGGLPDSGKSDLLTTSVGLTRLISGSLRLFGHDASNIEGDALSDYRCRIGLVFGDGGRIFEHLTVLENIALPWCYHHNCPVNEALPRVAEILDATGLEFLAARNAGRLSRSWRQRASLARALILHPEVLLLDNPLAGLDPRQSTWCLEFLHSLAAGHALYAGKPLTLVVATDDLRPWLKPGRQFGLLKQKHWTPLPDSPELFLAKEPLLEDLLSKSDRNT